MRKDTKLYNVFFPLWMLLLFPITWVAVLPVNFLFDSLVLVLGMFWLKVQDKKVCYRKSIFKIFAFGILADVVGSAVLFVMAYVLELGHVGDELYLTIPAMLVSAVLIFVLNYFVTFKGYEKSERFKMALLFAIVTAPYTFLVPTAWLYGW